MSKLHEISVKYLLPVAVARCLSNDNATRMWADAQRDGRHTEYRWRLAQCCKVWLTPTTR